MRNVRLWRELLGIDQRTVIEGIEVEEFEEEDADGDTLVVARLRPRSGVSRRCGRSAAAPCYDRSDQHQSRAWIQGASRWCSRPMRRGWSSPAIGPRWSRCRRRVRRPAHLRLR